jgi:hypothetical protein
MNERCKQEIDMINTNIDSLKTMTDKKEFPLDNEVEVGIHFDISSMSKEHLDKLFQAERLLRELGISFDTGAGGGERDWEWDWSLHGPVHVTFRKMVKDNPKNRYIREANAKQKCDNKENVPAS